MAFSKSVRFDTIYELRTNLCITEENIMKPSALTSLLSYNNLVHAISGTVGSAVSMCVFFPLDTARTRLQVDDKLKAKHSPAVIADIINQEGFQSLYRGLFPVVSSLCCSNFVYFYVYNGLKALLLSDPSRKPDPGTDLLFAFIAGVVNVLLTNPMWVVNTRLKLQGVQFETQKYRDDKQLKFTGILDAFIKIARYEGIPALWSGTKASLVLASNPSIHFMVYEAIKRFFQNRFQQKELSAFVYFLIGAIAKMAATVITYPIQILQSRQRAGYSKAEQKKGFFEAFISLLRAQGLSGLYKGMEAKLLQTVLTAALMFMVYEKMAAFIFHQMGVKK